MIWFFHWRFLKGYLPKSTKSSYEKSLRTIEFSATYTAKLPFALNCGLKYGSDSCVLLIMYRCRQSTALSKQVQIGCYIALQEMEQIKYFKSLYLYQVTILYPNFVAMETL